MTPNNMQLQWQSLLTKIAHQLGIQIPSSVFQHPGTVVLVSLFMVAFTAFLFNGVVEFLSLVLMLVFRRKHHGSEIMYGREGVYLTGENYSFPFDQQTSFYTQDAHRNADIHHNYHDPSTAFGMMDEHFEFAEQELTTLSTYGNVRTGYSMPNMYDPPDRFEQSCGF